MDSLFIFNSLSTLWLPAVVILSLSTIAGRWVVLGRMGRRRWAALIPIFSTWEISEGASGNRALSTAASAASAANLISLLMGFGRYYESQWVALLLFAFFILMQLIVSERLARSFGVGLGYAAGLVFVPLVAYPLLVSNNNVYLGPVDGAAS